jgi:SAM-dependent methyltransferase
VAREGVNLSGVTDERIRANVSDDEADLGRSTIASTRGHAQEYFDRTVSADLGPLYDRFLQYVKPGGRILDLGSGSGRDLKAMLDRGYFPLGIDASPSLAKLAGDFSGATCLTLRFEDLKFGSEFDAAWACASLLHMPKIQMPSILQNIHRSLAEYGVLFVSVQIGQGEKLLPDGRFFAYYAPEEFFQILEGAGYTIQKSWLSQDSLCSRRQIDWLNIVANR